jgi:hypothetical protein
MGTWEGKVEAYGDAYRQMHTLGVDLANSKSVHKANNAKVRAWRLNIARVMDTQEKRQTDNTQLVAINNALSKLNEVDTNMPTIENEQQALLYIDKLREENKETRRLANRIQEIKASNRLDVLGSIRERQRKNEDVIAQLEEFIELQQQAQSDVDAINDKIKTLNAGGI